MQARILSIAGSDPCGGAGIQADIKTIAALGGYAMAAVTALTVQDTTRVYDIHSIPADFVAAQVRTVLADIRPDAIKLGMTGNRATLAALEEILTENSDIPAILDPVLRATGGQNLFADSDIQAFVTHLFPHITILTPNLDEAAAFTGMADISTLETMTAAGQKLRAMGPKAVVVTGGHLAGPLVSDILVSDAGVQIFSSPALKTDNTHGTGCSFAAALATGIGQGLSLSAATRNAHDYVHNAILKAPALGSGLGKGKGPLNHFFAKEGKGPLLP